MGAVKKLIMSLSILVLFFAEPAHANVGFPMIAIVWPLFWFALIPIILIEYYAWIKIFDIKLNRKIFGAISIANVVSTLIGIPITWFILVVIELLLGGGRAFSNLNDFWQYFLGVTLQAPWLLPFEGQLYWMIPTACLVLFIPFYFMSCWLEEKVVRYYLKEYYSTSEIKEAVRKVNRASYAFLYLVAFIWLIYAIKIKELPIF